MSRSINADKISADKLGCKKFTLDGAKVAMASGSRATSASNLTLSGDGAGTVVADATGLETWFTDGTTVFVNGTAPACSGVSTSQQITVIDVPVGAAAAGSLAGSATKSSGTVVVTSIKVGQALSGGVQKLVIDCVVSGAGDGNLQHQYSYSYQLA